MNDPEQERGLLYEAIVADILRMVVTSRYGMFVPKEIKVGAPWKLIKNDELKLILIHQDASLFVKVYAPACEQEESYVSRAYAALRELSRLETTIPILAPLARSGDILIFPAGESGDPISPRRLPELDRNAIKTILQKYNLTPLSDHFGKLDIIQINDQRYLIDPFDDTAADIFP